MFKLHAVYANHNVSNSSIVNSEDVEVCRKRMKELLKPYMDNDQYSVCINDYSGYVVSTSNGFKLTSYVIAEDSKILGDV